MRNVLMQSAPLVLALAMGWSSAAQAQTVGGNEVWLDQVGGLNSVDILQDGRGNQAGADNVFLLLNQDGVANALTLSQIGYNNRLGTLFGDEPNFARGVWQQGDLNIIEITQFNTDTGGVNVIGAVQQLNAYSLPTDSAAFNALTILQTSEHADGDTGFGGHYIGRIVQDHTGDVASATNTVSIIQRGGGDGEGNSFADIRQLGSGNVFSSEQTGQFQMIGERPTVFGELPIGGIVQEGTANQASVIQAGVRNVLEFLEQYGRANKSVIQMNGARNVLVRVFQNNEAWAEVAVGNRIRAIIDGDDNGGGGTGWAGEMLLDSTLGIPGVAQAVLRQLGDDNGLDLTIITGLESKFGASQIGDGNTAFVDIGGILPGGDAWRNETAVFQLGDLNHISHSISGNDNAGAIQQEGSGNRLDLNQTGNFNFARAVMIGDENNGTRSALFGPALTLANAVTDVSLTRGRIVQVGTGGAQEEQNTALVSVTGGNLNAFAVYQNGASNTAAATISGVSNAMALVQQGQGNTGIVGISGADNIFALRQF